jgi:hypothetical protein
MAAPDCNISAFQNKDMGSLSGLQLWSYYYSLSQGEWDTAKRSLDTGATYGIISGDMSYDEMHNKAKSQLEILDKSALSKFAKSWATSVLTKEGLQAYMHCQGGLQLAFESFDDQGGKVMLDWSPPPGFGSRRHLGVAMADNVKNKRDIDRLLKSQEAASSVPGFEFYVSKQDGQKSAELTIATTAFSQTIDIPAAPPPVRDQKATFSVNTNQTTCDGVRNNDKVFCPIFETVVLPLADGDIRIEPQFKLDIEDDGTTDDPHRYAYVIVNCDNSNFTSGTLGIPKVKSANVAYTGRTVCPAKQGQQVRVVIQVNPRGGSSVLASGDVSIASPIR